MKNDVVKLSIPAKAQYLVTARLSASTLGADINMTIDDLEDLKTAVAEACILLMHSGQYGAIDITFHLEADKIRCVLEGKGQGLGESIHDGDVELTEFLLDAMTVDLNVSRDAQNQPIKVEFYKVGLPA